MNESASPAGIRASTSEDQILDQAESGPLPLFGWCSEIHSSQSPDFLPKVGESDEQASKLFAHPSEPDKLW